MKMIMNTHWRRTLTTLGALATVAFIGVVFAEEPAAPAAVAAPPAYSVDCPANSSAAEACTVDKGTYFGWRTFAVNCQVCHGGSALGSTFAPNLVDRLNTRVDYPRFIEVLTNGYTGQVGAMPPWKSNTAVMQHADDLFRYLRARADGKLPPGRPERSRS